MEQLILRQAAIDALRTCYDTETITMDNGDEYINYGDAVGEIEQLPPNQPEPQEIGYDDCANALLKMWMDNVLTDGEYYRIANKLNVKWGKVELSEPYKGVNT